MWSSRPGRSSPGWPGMASVSCPRSAGPNAATCAPPVTATPCPASRFTLRRRTRLRLGRMRRYLVIANAHAGRVEREALDAAVGVLSAAGPTEVHMSTDAAALDAALTGLDGRIPVVAGGDGSLHLVVNRLRRAGRLDQVTLGLLPLGTGNDFARAARVPLDPLAAAVALTTARPRRFDLLEDDTGRVVVNAAHAGLGAEAAAAAADHKPRLGALAYPLGALLAGLREEGWVLRVSVDGTPYAIGERLLMVGVANGPTIGRHPALPHGTGRRRPSGRGGGRRRRPRRQGGLR